MRVASTRPAPEQPSAAAGAVGGVGLAVPHFGQKSASLAPCAPHLAQVQAPGAGAAGAGAPLARSDATSFSTSSLPRSNSPRARPMLWANSGIFLAPPKKSRTTTRRTMIHSIPANAKRARLLFLLAKPAFSVKLNLSCLPAKPLPGPRVGPAPRGYSPRQAAPHRFPTRQPRPGPRGGPAGPRAARAGPCHRPPAFGRGALRARPSTRKGAARANQGAGRPAPLWQGGRARGGG